MKPNLDPGIVFHALLFIFFGSVRFSGSKFIASKCFSLSQEWNDSNTTFSKFKFCIEKHFTFLYQDHIRIWNADMLNTLAVLSLEEQNLSVICLAFSFEVRL